MKAVTRFIGLLCLPFIVVSCGREAQEQNDNPSTYLVAGQWKVRECTGAAVPASSLASYDISFAQDGSLSARYNGTAVSGTWSMHQKVEGKSISVRINGQGGDVSVLNNEWNIRYFDASTVKLEQSGTHLSLGRP
ncbi:MAG: hypothetical protein EOP50_03480 [Sphingobacteriales bacterium]|nr:MAG: hypothetical protein EOP50_03480 [Sphingobacteriales bacterium]